MVLDSEPKIEEISSDDSDEETPELQNVKSGNESSDSDGKTNRSEKKMRKATQKLGFKPFPGVIRVTVKSQKNLLFVIGRPDVMKAPSSDCYAVFGEAKVEDMSSAMSQMAAAAAAGVGPNPGPAAGGAALPGLSPGNYDSGAMGKAQDAAKQATVKGGSPSRKKAGDGEVEVNEKDIELVMTQIESATREQAIAALKAHNNDIVEAIVSFDGQK